MKTKFLGLLSWKQSGSSSFSLNKFNSQANKDWTHNSYTRSHWMVLIRAAAVCTQTSKCLPMSGGSWAYDAQTFPEELKKWPWADVVCVLEQEIRTVVICLDRCAKGHYKTGCSSSVFYVGLIQSSSSLTLVDLASCSESGRLQELFCSLVQILLVLIMLDNYIWEINEKKTQELQSIGFSA